MRKIEEIKIWLNGENKSAKILDAKIINDDLKSSCTFYYQLKEEDKVIQSLIESEENIIIYGNKLFEGNIELNGNEYLEWDGSNDFVFDFIAKKLNLKLIL